MDLTWLYGCLSVLYYVIVYPILWVLSWLFFILTWIAAPLIYLSQFLLQVGLFPFRLLQRFETIYVYLGVAVLLGIFSGFVLHSITSFGTQIFDLDRPPRQKDKPARGHTAASYRVARQQKRRDEELRQEIASRLLATQPLLREALQSPSQGRRATPSSPKKARKENGLLSTTILEEVESSEEDYNF